MALSKYERAPVTSVVLSERSPRMRANSGLGPDFLYSERKTRFASSKRPLSKYTRPRRRSDSLLPVPSLRALSNSRTASSLRPASAYACARRSRASGAASGWATYASSTVIASLLRCDRLGRVIVLGIECGEHALGLDRAGRGIPRVLEKADGARDIAAR